MGLKRVLRNWLMNDENYEENKPCGVTQGQCYPSIDEGTPDADAILNFKVYSAVGSHIVEFNRYDRHNDRRNTTLYTISNDEDFGDKIAKISAMEIIKQ